MASNCPKHHNRFAYRSVSVFSGEPNGFKRAPVRRTRPAPALVSVFSGEPNGFKLLVTNHEPCTTVVSVFSGEPNGFKHDAVGPGAEINRVSVFSGEPNGFKPIRAAHHDASKLCFSVLWRTEWLQTIERGGLISGGTLFQCSLANRMASKLKHLQMGVCMSCFSVLWRTEWLQTVRRRRQSRLGRGVSVFSGEPNGFKRPKAIWSSDK